MLQHIPGPFLRCCVPGAETELFCTAGLHVTSGGHGHPSQCPQCVLGVLTCMLVSEQMLEQVLRELQPLCTTEQQFIEKFFHLSQNTAELQVLEVSMGTRSSPVPLAHPSSLIQASSGTVGCLITFVAYQSSPGLWSSGNSQWCQDCWWC